MKELVFLLEEASAKAMLESLLPRILNSDIKTRFIAFEGKQDLEKQLARRMRGYVNPLARFIVLRDQDNAPDCKAVKTKLAGYCQLAGQTAKSLVRIACRELEAFYLADLRAVEQGLKLQNLENQQHLGKFRDPDRLGSPSRELTLLTKGIYQKVSGSRAIGAFLDPANTRSPSFNNLILGIQRMECQLLSMQDSP